MTKRTPSCWYAVRVKLLFTGGVERTEYLRVLDSPCEMYTRADTLTAAQEVHKAWAKAKKKRRGLFKFGTWEYDIEHIMGLSCDPVRSNRSWYPHGNVPEDRWENMQ